MRNPFAISLLSAAVLLSGCAGNQPVELGTVATRSVYDDRMLDSLGSQRYTEQQMLYLRRVESFEHQLQELENKRRALESSIGLSQLEAASGGIMASDDEAARMSEFASATHATQARIAEEHAGRAMKQALIENERDRKLMQAEIEANRRLAELDQLQRQSDAAELEARAQLRTHESRLLEQQRMTVVLANADAERRVQKDIDKTQESLAKLRGEKAQAVSAYKAEIAQLKERIKLLEGKVDSAEAGFDAQMTIERNRLANLQAEAEKLARVGESLMEAQVATPTNGVLSSTSLEPARNLGSDASFQASASDLAKSRALEMNAREERLIRAELAAAKTEITNAARTELASLDVQTEIAKARIVAPVVTSRAVYSGSYGEEPQAFAARAKTPLVHASVAAAPDAAKKTASQVSRAAPSESRSSTAAKPIASPVPAVEPIRVVSTFEPRHEAPVRQMVQESVISAGTMSAGQVQPLVIAARATTYNVVYRYAEKGSADKFMAFLRAYGVEDFSYRFSHELGEHILFMGKYTDKEKALARVAFLNSTTKTSNAKIVENDI